MVPAPSSQTDTAAASDPGAAATGGAQNGCSGTSTAGTAPVGGPGIAGRQGGGRVMVPAPPSQTDVGTATASDPGAAATGGAQNRCSGTSTACAAPVGTPGIAGRQGGGLAKIPARPSHADKAAAGGPGTADTGGAQVGGLETAAQDATGRPEPVARTKNLRSPAPCVLVVDT